MLTASVRIQAPFERDVGAVVASEDGPRRVSEVLRLAVCCLDLRFLVEFDMEPVETVRRVVPCAAAPDDREGAFHPIRYPSQGPMFRGLFGIGACWTRLEPSTLVPKRHHNGTRVMPNLTLKNLGAPLLDG